jgi:hypothetical protein
MGVHVEKRKKHLLCKLAGRQYVVDIIHVAVRQKDFAMVRTYEVREAGEDPICAELIRAHE